MFARAQELLQRLKGFLHLSVDFGTITGGMLACIFPHSSMQTTSNMLLAQSKGFLHAPLGLYNAAPTPEMSTKSVPPPSCPVRTVQQALVTRNLCTKNHLMSSGWFHFSSASLLCPVLQNTELLTTTVPAGAVSSWSTHTFGAQ